MKIVVLLGTQNKPFHRLLEAIENSEFVLQHEVIIQSGYTSFNSTNFTSFDFCTQEEINHLINDADLLITHAGVGSITNALKREKKVIVAPRLSKYKEMKNDHQLQIMEAFAKKGYVLPLIDFNQIDDMVKISKNFIPNKYESNVKNVISCIEDFIN